jgi:hypothetical protein
MNKKTVDKPWLPPFFTKAWSSGQTVDVHNNLSINAYFSEVKSFASNTSRRAGKQNQGDVVF